MWKNFITDYLSFTKKERSGTLVILLLIVFFITIPFLFPFFIPRKTVSDITFKSQMDQLVNKQMDTVKKMAYKNYDKTNSQYSKDEYSSNYAPKKIEGQLFMFDPNTLDEAGWHRLGVSNKTTSTIQKFVSKGGKFYKPQDIGKIWGLQEAEINRLLPFVVIEQKKSAYPDSKPFDKKLYDKPIYKPSVVDINAADTTMLIALPGIGSKLALRIIVFRDKLGGFYKVDQIGETFGLRDSVFQLLKARFSIGETPVKQLNINTATLDELKAHPYLRYVIANAIVQYRTQHGNFTALADIKKIMLVTEEIFIKAAPYLKL